jgi:hypothetical protein
MSAPYLDDGPKVDCPEGRQVVEGLVVSEKTRDDGFGPEGRQVLTVKIETPEGAFVIWGTSPKALREAPGLRGSTVRFTATLTRSDRDPSFGFFSRPAKAEVLEQGDAPKPELIGASGSTFRLLEQIMHGKRNADLTVKSVGRVLAQAGLERQRFEENFDHDRENHAQEIFDGEGGRLFLRIWPNGCAGAWYGPHRDELRAQAEEREAELEREKAELLADVERFRAGR